MEYDFKIIGTSAMTLESIIIVLKSYLQLHPCGLDFNVFYIHRL